LLNAIKLSYYSHRYPSLIYYWHCSIFRNIPGITTFPPCAYLFARLLPPEGKWESKPRRQVNWRWWNRFYMPNLQPISIQAVLSTSSSLTLLILWLTLITTN